jgi:carbon starvation protein
VFVAGVFASVWVGIQNPLVLVPEGGSTFLPTVINANVSAWIPVIILYAAIASALPVWMLLQPRDYLSSFLLYAGVGGALVAIIIGTVGGMWLGITPTPAQPFEVNIAAFNGFWGVTGSVPLFPLLFITIACGTISGFHSLVSSGTTSKQLNRETDARTIGYGGMLGEGLLATVALVSLAVAGASLDPGGGIGVALPNFATGGGIFLSALGIPQSFGAPFMALVLVSFLLTSTDTAVRLGRYMMEEIVGTPETSVEKFATDRYANAALQGIPAYILITSGSWVTLWQLFGGANQLLAALALLTATVWLANWDDSKQLISTGVPMAVMVTITTMGLLWLAFGIISAVVQMLLALTLIYLALSLVKMGYENIQKVRNGGAGAALADGGTVDSDD